MTDSPSTELVPLDQCQAGPLAPPETIRIRLSGPSGLHDALLDDAKKPHTRRARAGDVRALSTWMGLDSPAEALALLVSGGVSRANAIAAGFQSHQQTAGLASATINRRSSTLTRAVTLGRRYGLLDWALEVDSRRDEIYRDTAGPGREGWKRFLNAARRIDQLARTPLSIRNLAIVHLLYYAALRRGEIASLDLDCWDPEASRVSVLRKGKDGRRFVPIPKVSAIALNDWRQHRGSEPGPLFIRLDRAHDATRLERLSGDAIYDMIGEISVKAKIKRTTPHGLRHAAITWALEKTNGNVAIVQEFAGHAGPGTTMIYNDNRRKSKGEVGQLLAEDDVT